MLFLTFSLEDNFDTFVLFNLWLEVSNESFICLILADRGLHLTDQVSKPVSLRGHESQARFQLAILVLETAPYKNLNVYYFDLLKLTFC